MMTRKREGLRRQERVAIMVGNCYFFGVIQNECQPMILALFFPFSYFTRP